MNDNTKALQGDALPARTRTPKLARSSLGRHARRFDDSPISFQVTLPDGSVQLFGRAAPRFEVRLKNAQALRALTSLDEGRIGEAYLAGDLDIDGDMLAPFALRGSMKDFHPSPRSGASCSRCSSARFMQTSRQSLPTTRWTPTSS
jgi:hypothetical protein